MEQFGLRIQSLEVKQNDGVQQQQNQGQILTPSPIYQKTKNTILKKFRS